MSYIASKVLTARKEHFCELCCCKINIGQKYKKVTGADEYGIDSSSYHTECSELFSRIHWTEEDPQVLSDAFDCFIYDYIDERKKVIETEDVHLLVKESTEEMLKYFEPYRKQFVPSIFEAF